MRVLHIYHEEQILKNKFALTPLPKDKLY